MSNCIQILSESNHDVLWSQNLPGDTEALTMKNIWGGRPVVPIFPATLQPVRTNSLKNFSKDFFLPTVVNHAVKVNNIIGKIFAILFALILDLLTFPIRLVTFIPRMITNSKQEEHPLHRYFVGNGVPPQLLENGRVTVKISWVPAPKSESYEIQNVNFIEVPIYDHFDMHHVVNHQQA